MDRKSFLTSIAAASAAVSAIPATAYAQQTTFTIGSVMDPTICTPFLVAADKGLFKKHEVPANIKLFSSGAVITQAISGRSLEFGATGGVPGTLLAGHQVGVRMIARVSDISWELALMAMPKSSIKSPSDVKGKTIGMTDGTVSQYLVLAFAEHWDIPISSIKMVNLNPSDQVNALETGKIDIASLWLPFTTRAEEAGAVPLETALHSNFPGKSGNVKLVGDPGILFGTNEFLNKNPDITVRMLQAVYEAEQWMSTHRAEAATIAQSHLNVSAKSLEDDFKRAQIFMSFDRDLVDELRNEWGFLQKQGIITAPFAAEGWIDPTFMRRAEPKLVSVK